MNCTRFEELLFEGLDTRLAAADEEAMRSHAGTCASCRELAAVVGGEIDEAAIEVPADLVDGVLARTSEAVARVLAQLQEDLPTLAEMDPGDGFVADVMAATVGSAAADTAVEGRAPWRRRFEEMWERIAARPRLAFEGAYIAAFMVFLVFGLPSRSVAELPARAFDGIRQEGAKVERVVSAGLSELAELGRGAWAESTGQAAGLFTSDQSGDATGLGRALQFWTDTARGIAGGLWNGVLAPVIEQIRALLSSTPPDGATTI